MSETTFYKESFKTFFRIGIFTLGGGYAMIPVIESEIVDKKKWINKEDFLDIVAMAQTCPGVFAINVSVFIGYKLHKIKGALCTAIGTALP
ncbi:MAG: chromate transporter, partial [Paraprevotella sp.]|nr:chromate transporter [Paraprevotella sp.]